MARTGKLDQAIGFTTLCAEYREGRNDKLLLRVPTAQPPAKPGRKVVNELKTGKNEHST